VLGLSRLLTGQAGALDHLRYGPRLEAPGAARPPVVVWTATRRCNLHCMHCYADAHDRPYPDELTTDEAVAMLEDLAHLGVPVVLFSGGEPLMRPDLFALARHAQALGIRTTLSTNGTLITAEVAEQLHATGFGYVGISLDGIGSTNDRFRGKRGAFEAALQGIRNCRAVGQRVGLRLTLTRRTVDDLAAILALIEREGIDRACFYHLVYAGRGRRIANDELAPAETRNVIDQLIDWVRDLQRRGMDKEVLTVDNHADGPYLWLRLAREHGPERAAEVWRLLARNGGNNSGVAIGHVDHAGNVHPDQFSWPVTFGNVRERPFSAVWTEPTHPLLVTLRQRAAALPERCRQCRFLPLCNGNLRARALAATGDFWGMDPACYLTDEEIRGRDATSMAPARPEPLVVESC